MRLDSPSIEYGTTEAIQARTARAVWSDLSPAEFDYMLAFWRTGVAEGALAFLIDLPLGDAASIEHIAQFTGGLRVTGVTGGSATVEGEISLIPRVAVHPLSTARAGLIDLITEVVE